MEQVCQGWETLELDIPGGDGERTLAEAIHGYILWDKRYISILVQHGGGGNRRVTAGEPAFPGA